VVDDLLDSLSGKFANVSKEIYDKIEAMSRRLDAMEASLQQGTGTGGTAATAGTGKS
jgi:heat shock factor-binding protein 1